MRSDTIQKRNTLNRTVRLMIVLAAIFALLLVGYFAILRPLLAEDDEVTEQVKYSPIWASEVEAANGRVLMYPHHERSQINKISIHNPDNAKFGEQYVDWGFYRYTGPEENEDGLVPNDFYLINYEYAPFNEQALSNVVVGAGYTLTTSRVEDHCDDYSRYGLDFADLSEATTVTMETTDGKTYTYCVGDKIPSGSGYYVRVLGEDTLLSTGEKVERDSVYIISPNNLEAALLSSPVEMVTPTLSLPINTQSTELIQSFFLWRHEPEYIFDSTDEDGNVTQKLAAALSFKPLNSNEDPFSLFAGLSIYYSESHPGYYASSNFESVVSGFSDFSGTEVVELGVLLTNDEGETYYGFTNEMREKYGLGPDQIKYSLRYTYQGIENDVYFSALQENSYYYAYSLTFNTICKVSAEEAYFLQWEDQAFLLNQLVYLNIDKCDSIKISGSYFDLGVVNPDRTGLQKVDETYQLTGTAQTLVVNTADGKKLDVPNFREFYQILISIANRGAVTAEEGKAALEKGDLVAEIAVSTRRTTTTSTDENGKTVQHTLESVTKRFRFYRLTDGRLYCTIEQIDAEGKSTGEAGSFYVLSSRLDQLLAATIDLREGLPIDEHQRY